MTSLLNQGSSSSSSPPRAPTTTSVQRSSAGNNTDVTSHHRHHQDVNHSGSPVSSSTTIMQTPQDLFEKVQSEVKQKLDVVQHVHEVAYGMLLRELQRAILERGVSDKEAQENFLNARRAEDALRRAELRNAELEAANNDFRASIEAKEQEVLGWRQRADAVEKDLEWTKKELARVVSEADHNRQLLAMEVRNRAVMLKSMHENVGGGGGSSSGNAITSSSSSSPAVAVVAPGVNTNEEEGTRNTESSVSLSTRLSRPPVVASTGSYEAAAEAASATISEIAADVRRTLLSNSNSVVQPYRTFGGTQGPLVSPPPPQGGQHRQRSSPQRNAFSSSSLITPWRGLAQSVNDSLQSPSSEQAILAPSLAPTINNNTTTRLSLVFTPSSSTMTLSPPPPPPPPRSQWNDVAPPWDPPRQRVVAEGTAPPPWLS